MPINLGKDPISLNKGSKIRARMFWPASTDFDLGLEILYSDGTTESVATFPASGLPAKSQSADGRVKHSGDVRRLPGATQGEEYADVDLSDRPGRPSIRAVLPWAYSAQSNGATSFHGTQVGLEVTDGTTTVQVLPEDASRDRSVWTETVGMITNYPGEGPKVVRAEHYSDHGSENRPSLRWSDGGTERRGLRKVDVPAGAVVSMNGPRNSYK